MRAADQGHIHLMRMLLDAGADKEATRNVRHRSLLLNCTFSLIFFTLRFMFNLGTFFVCVGGPVLQNGFTALICASDRGQTDCVRLLLDAGADKEAKSNVRRRSLFFICVFSISSFYLRSISNFGSFFLFRVACVISLKLCMRRLRLRLAVWRDGADACR